MQKLSPTLQTWLDDYNRNMRNLLAAGFQPTPENTRKGLATLTSSLVTRIPEVTLVRDDVVEASNLAIPVRIYHPHPEADLPVLVYLHGGGHMSGSVAVYDPICRKLANAARHIVVSADYRLTPEHPYPAGIEDAWTVAANVWQLLVRQGLKHRKHLAIGGDSGGGAMSATVAHLALDAPDIKIHRQVLIYPGLDYTLSHPTIDLYATGLLLEKSKIQWYFDHYFQHNEDRKSVSPLHMEMSPKLPKTLVITAEFCPLRDEGVAYVEKLISKGAEAQHLHFDDMIHAFMNLENLTAEACKTLYKAIGTFLDLDQN